MRSDEFLEKRVYQNAACRGQARRDCRAIHQIVPDDGREYEPLSRVEDRHDALALHGGVIYVTMNWRAGAGREAVLGVRRTSWDISSSAL